MLLKAIKLEDAGKYSLAFLAVAAAVLVLALSGRRYFTFGVENDLFMQFIPEAQRFLDGEPLQLPYHPPVYPIVLATMKAIVGSWLAAGLAISVCATAATMWLSFLLFRSMCGAVAGIGALLGVVTSSAMVAHAGLASSDTLYVMLFVATATAAVMASRSGSPRLWLLAGVLVGLAVLTRTNGITLLAVALLPWLRREHRLRNGGLIVAGIVASLGLWVVYAAVTGSKLGPEGSHVSLAYHFYHRDLLFDDASVLLVGEFGSVVDVVLHDPMRIVVLYVRGLYNVFHELLAADFLLDSPINLLVLPGLVYLLATSSRELYGYLLLLVVPQILLLNLAIADQRYYLFLVPLFGASAIATVAMLVAAVGRPAWRTAIVAGFVGCVLVAAGSSAREAGRLWSANVVELEQAIAAVRSAAGESTLVVARKEHIAYYTGLPHRWLPASLSELQSDLASAGRDDVLIYIGSEEIKLRPGIEALAAAEDLPDWLVPVTGGQTPVPWRLLRYAGASASADRSADTR